MSAAGTWDRMRVFSAPLGARFRYVDRPGSVYVLLDRADCGVCGADVAPIPGADRPPLQGLYSVAETRNEFEAMEANVWIPASPTPDNGSAA